MNSKRIRLVNAARKALFQRSQAMRSIGEAKANFAPTALKRRATKKVVAHVEDAADSVERGLRRYSVPLGLAAAAGLAFAFRRPLSRAAHVVADQISDAAKSLAAQLSAHADDNDDTLPNEKDCDNEPV